MRVTNAASHAEKVRRRTAARQNAARHTNPLQRRRATLVSTGATGPTAADLSRPRFASTPALMAAELLASALFRGARTRRTRELERQRLEEHRRRLSEPITW